MSFFYRAFRGNDFGGCRSSDTPRLLEAFDCLTGRSSPVRSGISEVTRHVITSNLLLPPYPKHLIFATFGMGCFWCAESLFYRKKGVYITAVGYSQGETKNPSYEEVCSGKTNHVEVVRIVFDPTQIKYEELLKEFWDRHDPTTPMRQGNDYGTQYRSGIYFHSREQQILAEESKKIFQDALQLKHPNVEIVTEIESERNFFFAEEFHQQYDAKPGSRKYCGLKPTGVMLPADFVKRNP